MRLHLLGIPHTITRLEYSHCAFTEKVRQFSAMIQPLGYEVIHYGNAGANTQAVEHVDLLSEKEFREAGGEDRDPTSPGWYYGDRATMGSPLYELFNDRLAAALKKHVDRARDIVCVPFGPAHSPALAAFGEVLAVETGIGYRNSYLPYRIFESYAWMHRTLGSKNDAQPDQPDLGDDYWWVIPNPYDLREWPRIDAERSYVLYLGRLGEAKGLAIIMEVARRRPDLQFVLVGQGDPEPWRGFKLPNVEVRAPVYGAARPRLLAGALATMTPTRYIEPFGQVHAQSLLMGTPVIASDFGVFTETVEDGVNGFRCHTLGDYMAAVERAEGLDRERIRADARARFGFDRVGVMYDRVFKQLDDLRREGYLAMRSWFGPIRRAARV